MNVAIYAGMFEKDKDGATKTLYKLVETLLEKNEKVGVWSFSLTHQEKEGLFLYETPSIPLPLYPDYKIALPTWKIKKQLDEFEPDIVHITVPDLIGKYFLRYAEKNKLPIVFSYHTNFLSYLQYYNIDFLRNPLWKYFKNFYNKGDIVLAPTEEIVKHLSNKGIKRAEIWSRGINREVFNPKHRSEKLRKKWGAEGKKVILYSGRFVWYKDLGIFTKVYELFKSKGPKNVFFVLAGDGPIKDELKERMPDACFPGYLYGKELSEVYASSDILLFPSTTETFGNVVLEALSSGLPVVVSNIGGCKEIAKKSKGGFVAKAKSPKSFYSKCKELVVNENTYNKKRENGLKYTIEKSWGKINYQLIKKYEKLINEKKD